MSEKKQVIVNGLRQNCYVLDTRTVMQDNHISPPRFTSELKRITTDNGYREVVETIPHPITAESVNSYVDSADYRRDPMQALANAPKRVNLGDVTQIQEFVENDPMQAVRVLNDVREKLQTYLEQVQQPPQPQPPQPQPPQET